MDSLKVLDPEGPIREADIKRSPLDFRHPVMADAPFAAAGVAEQA
jgi:hypothetical protein